MPARTTITVNDRESTPVAHAFTPRGDIAGAVGATFRTVANTLIEEESLILRWGTSQNGRRTARVTIADPYVVTETINGVNVPKVLGVGFVDLNIRFDADVPLQQRKNLVGMLANLLASSQAVVEPVVTGVEGVW